MTLPLSQNRQFFGMSEHFDIRDGLPDMKIECLHFDDDGMLWIGTHSRGLASFDGESFRLYTERDGISGRSVYSICSDCDGALWVGTDSGITRYFNGRFVSFDTQGRSCLWGAAVDDSNHVWFGLDRSPGEGPAVACYAAGDLVFHGLTDEKPHRGASINSVIAWRGEVWCAGDGLFVMRDGHSDRVGSDVQELQHLTTIAAVSEACLLVGSPHGTFILEEDESLSPLAEIPVVETAISAQDGVLVTTRAGSVFRVEDGGVSRICDLTVPLWRSVAEDDYSRLWIGTYGFGLYRHDSERLRVYSEESGVSRAQVRAVDAEGEVSLAMSGGLVQRDSEKRFAAVPSWIEIGHENPDITALARDTLGRLWIGKRNGYVYVQEGQSYERCVTDERLAGYAIDSMEVDSDGRVWVASSVGAGLACYEGPQVLRYIDPSESPFSPPRVSAIATGPDGEVYVGSAHPNVWDGIAELTGDGFRRAPGVAGVAVSALCIGMDGRLWVGSNEGLSVLDDDYVVSYGTSDGLPTDLITALFCDRKGAIWIGTEGGGLAVHDGQTITAMTVPRDPFCNTITSISEGDCAVWIATNGGLLERRLREGQVHVEVTGVTADREYAPAEEAQIPDSVNRITIHVSGRSKVDASRDLVFRYRLVGYDAVWRQTNTPQLDYPALRAGDYSLEVQAVDRDQNYSGVFEYPVSVVADPRLDAYREALSAEGAQGDFIGDSSRMAEVIRQIQEVAWTDLTVLILGETGTGKGIAAKRIHECSERHAGPFVYVNCGSMQEGLVDSELFGHEKGSFTGAFAKKLGKFELAQGGSIFLDEIGDLPLESQARLLKVLQDKTIERVGGTQTISVDVRVVAATNRNLAEAIQEKRYRADLFYRLNVFPIEIPPLRERRDDTPALAKHFVSTFASHLSRPIPRIAVDAMEEMMAYDWPGNVRELEHVLQRAVILSVGSEIASEDLGIHSGKKGGQTESLGAFPTLEENERQYLLRALSHTNGVIHGPQGAASLVQVKPTTLRSRLERLGVSFKKNDPTRDIRDTK